MRFIVTAVTVLAAVAAAAPTADVDHRRWSVGSGNGNGNGNVGTSPMRSTCAPSSSATIQLSPAKLGHALRMITRLLGLPHALHASQMLQRKRECGGLHVP